jgi:hypothetical protein
MNTRDYQTEIDAMKKSMDGLFAKRTAAAGGRALLKLPELIMRRPLNARTALAASISRLDREFEKIHAEHSALVEEADEVVRAEGVLVRCAKCGIQSRSHFGGQLDDTALGLLGWDDPLAVQGWQCSDCLAPALKRVEEIALWHGSFVGVYEKQFLPGYEVVADKGLVGSGDEYANTADVKADLALRAARLGANACLCFVYERNKEDVVAGHGPKGNPYYRKVVTYSGKARAVVLQNKPLGRHKSLEKEFNRHFH